MINTEIHTTTTNYKMKTFELDVVYQLQNVQTVSQEIEKYSSSTL